MINNKKTSLITFLIEERAIKEVIVNMVKFIQVAINLKSAGCII